MEELTLLVTRAQTGDLDAYAEIVRRFQDMAYGYAYSVLGDFHLAEDAAQEAFVQAYRDLSMLREAAAFAGWFRRIVFKHCDRITRRRRPKTAPPDALADTVSRDRSPAEAAERSEMDDAVLAAIQALPDTERTVTALYYINGYSHKDIAEFLEVPETTVNGRLRTSRKRLKERMMSMVADEIKSHPLADEFPERIRMLLALPRPLEIGGHPVQELWGIFRSCFPDAEIIELDEVCDRSISLLKPAQMEKFVYGIDERRMLRPEVTSQLLDLWLQKGGGERKWITVGRVFRAGHVESQATLEVFHQAELLWCAEDLHERDFEEVILNVASKLLPGIECRAGSPCSYGPVPSGKHYESPWGGRWRNVAAGGMIWDDWLTKAGLDPGSHGAIGFAFGLERCALIRGDVDDVRKLWQPPYVPAGR